MECLEWCGLDRPIKVLFVIASSCGGTILAMIAHLPAYGVGLVALGFFALAGVGANAWEKWWNRRKEMDGGSPKKEVEDSPLEIIFDDSRLLRRISLVRTS